MTRADVVSSGSVRDGAGNIVTLPQWISQMKKLTNPDGGNADGAINGTPMPSPSMLAMTSPSNRNQGGVVSMDVDTSSDLAHSASSPPGIPKLLRKNTPQIGHEEWSRMAQGTLPSGGHAASAAAATHPGAMNVDERQRHIATPPVGAKRRPGGMATTAASDSGTSLPDPPVVGAPRTDDLMVQDATTRVSALALGDDDCAAIEVPSTKRGRGSGDFGDGGGLGDGGGGGMGDGIGFAADAYGQQAAPACDAGFVSTVRETPRGAAAAKFDIDDLF